MAGVFAENVRYLRKVVMFAIASGVSIVALLLGAPDSFWQAWGLICLGAFGANGAEHLANGMRKPRPYPGAGVNAAGD